MVTENENVDPAEGEKVQKAKHKQQLKDLLYVLIDKMVDTLETVNNDGYVQLHMLSNDFTSDVKELETDTRPGIQLHDIFCEIDTNNLVITDVKHQLGFNQLLIRNKKQYTLATTIGELMIQSELKVNSKSGVISGLKRKFAEDLGRRTQLGYIRITDTRTVDRAILKPNGVILVPYDYIIDQNELDTLTRRIQFIFNEETARSLDSLVAEHNAKITETRIENKPIRVRVARDPEDARLRPSGRLYLHPLSSISNEELGYYIEEADLYDIDQDRVRQTIIEHNREVSERANLLQFSGLQIYENEISPRSTRYVMYTQRQGLINIAQQMQGSDVIVELVNRVIDNHNDRIVSRISVTTDDRLEVDNFLPTIVNGQLQPENLGVIGLETRRRIINLTTIRGEEDEVEEVKRIIDEHNARLINTGRAVLEDAPAEITAPPRARVVRRIDDVEEATNATVDIVREEPQDTYAEQVLQAPDPHIRETPQAYLTEDTDYLTTIRIHHGRLYPTDVGYINDEDRDLLIENAANYHEVDPVTMRDAIDNHNRIALRRLDINRDPNPVVEPTEHAIEEPVEIFELNDTGFDQTEIRRVLQENTIIVEEDTNDGEERPVERRPTQVGDI
jgi:hypothetical protein